jgi:hypothetical protein
LPVPGNCVCFWRHTIARWIDKSAAMAAGTIITWVTKRRPMTTSLGNSPPKMRNAIQLPINGTASAIEFAILSPTPDNRSSGSE